MLYIYRTEVVQQSSGTAVEMEKHFFNFRTARYFLFLIFYFFFLFSRHVFSHFPFPIFHFSFFIFHLGTIGVVSSRSNPQNPQIHILCVYLPDTLFPPTPNHHEDPCPIQNHPRRRRIFFQNRTFYLRILRGFPNLGLPLHLHLQRDESRRYRCQA